MTSIFKSLHVSVIAGLLLLALAWPSSADAQTVAKQNDPIWEGLLIGAAVGVVVGFVVAPPAFCGHNDHECDTIVRVAIGLPAIGVGIAVGGLVDHFHHQQAPGLAPFRDARSLNVTLRF